MISYDDFKKVEMKIGTVISAQRIPNTDKLINCTVDIGDENHRTIVSGIAEFYEPEELIGKQFPYVTNLEPRTICGVESRGMIIAISGEHGLSTMSPDKEVNPGSVIG